MYAPAVSRAVLAAFVACAAVGCGDDAVITPQVVANDADSATDDAGLADGSLDDAAGNDAHSDVGTDVVLFEFPPEDIQGTDAIDVGNDAAKDAETDAADADAGAISCPGSVGCACAKDADCPSYSACLDTAAGKQCITPCSTGTPCETGTLCVNVPGPDTTTTDDDKAVCAPKFPHLCDPCTASSTCPSTGVDKVACIGLGDGVTQIDGASGWFCSNFCLADSDCPSDYACISSNTIGGDTATFCRPKSGMCGCSSLASAGKLSTTCANTTGSLSGCKGTRTCGDAGLSACSAPVAVTEICDNVDNDCDGVTDNGSGNSSLCDDKNGCTSDSCSGGVCLFSPITATCDDGNICTASDGCDGGKCSGSAVNCDDGNPCTDDSCDPKSGCVHTNNSGVCSDNDPCTEGDSCKDGGCTSGTTNNCNCSGDGDCAQYEDGDKCNGTLYCAKAAAPYVCKINPTTVKICDPVGDNLCTINQCDKSDGKCKYIAQNDGKTCDDENVCTTGEICSSSTCSPQGSLPCNDDNPCTDDSCDPKNGCSNVPNTGGCSDNNACTGGDVCSGGTCAGVSINCNDGFACTADTCNPVSGCVNSPIADVACQITSTYAEPFDCGSGALDYWQRSDSLLSAGSVKWGFDATPAVPAPHSGGCSLNINNGTDLKCGNGQIAIAATAISPGIDLSAMATGTTVKATFYSVGDWSSSEKASVSVQIDGGGFSEVASVPTGSGWNKINIGSTTWSGHKIQFEFSFSGSCDGEGKPGWFIDDFAVFEDLCTTKPGICGANSLCGMDDSGQLNCTVCPPGYSAGNGTCNDIDECTAGTAGCSASATCTNSIGSFSCTCNAGFSGNGVTCDDVDECKSGKNNCALGATCNNTVGGFTCTCPPNTVGDGVTCGALGSSPSSPALSCLAIWQVAPKSADGVYYLDFDGSGPQATGAYFCDMKNGGWTRLIADDFESSQGGWSTGSVGGCGSFGKILGGYNQFGKGAATAKSVNAPPHSQAKLWMQYIRLDSWEQETGIVYVDSAAVWSQKSDFWCCWTGGWGNKCGMQAFADDTWDMGAGWVGAHSGSTVTVTATSTLDQGAGDESWGIDNVVLYVK